jgi:hypothetical protein
MDRKLDWKSLQEKVSAWVESPKGKASIKAAKEAVRKDTEALNKARTVTDEMLNRRFDI